LLRRIAVLIFTALFNRFPKAALLLGFLVIGSVSAVPVQAQETSPANPKSEIKSSLTELSNFYKSEVERLEKRHQQSQQLFTDGLISRVDLEKGEKELADARAKVEEITKQIAAANQPAPAITSNVVSDLATASGNQFWTTGSAKIDNLIRYYGGQYGVDPFLIYCTMAQESHFNVGATSYKGAQGLMQLMPGTAARYGVTNPYDVAQNIKGGTRYLKDLLKMFNGRVDLALAGYNAGEGAVMKYGNTIPPYNETRNYVRVILKRYNTGKQIS
jgi:soluble lytic murein transglycosylase-like protein